MKLSDLDPNDVTPAAKEGSLKLSDLNPSDISKVAAPEPSALRPIGEAAATASPWAGLISGGSMGGQVGAELGVAVAGPPGALIGAPLGAIVGGGLGYMSGGRIKKSIQDYLSPQPTPPQGGNDQLSDAVKDFGKGAAYETLGQGVSAAAAPILNPVAKYIGSRLAPEAAAEAVSKFPALENAGVVSSTGAPIAEKSMVQSATKPAGLFENAGEKFGSTMGAGMGGGIAGGAGAVVGKELGEGLGPLVGRGVDKVGAYSAKLFGDNNAFTLNQMTKIMASPFGKVLENAYQHGGHDSVNTTNYLLQQTNPEYQELLKNEQQ